MNTGYSVSLVVGVRASEIIEVSEIESEITRYDFYTGAPIITKCRGFQYILDGKPYDMTGIISILMKNEVNIFPNPYVDYIDIGDTVVGKKLNSQDSNDGQCAEIPTPFHGEVWDKAAEGIKALGYNKGLKLFTVIDYS